MLKHCLCPPAIRRAGRCGQDAQLVCLGLQNLGEAKLCPGRGEFVVVCEIGALKDERLSRNLGIR